MGPIIIISILWKLFINKERAFALSEAFHWGSVLQRSISYINSLNNPSLCGGMLLIRYFNVDINQKLWIWPIKTMRKFSLLASSRKKTQAHYSDLQLSWQRKEYKCCHHLAVAALRARESQIKFSCSCSVAFWNLNLQYLY